jgi:hypothetical protein
MATVVGIVNATQSKKVSRCPASSRIRPMAMRLGGEPTGIPVVLRFPGIEVPSPSLVVRDLVDRPARGPRQMRLEPHEHVDEDERGFERAVRAVLVDLDRGVAGHPGS